MESVRKLKESLLDRFAAVGHALASPKRLELLELLNQCEKSVETLSTNTSMSVANTSQHLQILRNAGLVETKRAGVRIFYRLADDEVHALLVSIKRLTERRNAEIGRIMSKVNKDAEEFEEVDREELLKLAEAGEIIILDIRPEDEFKAEHLPHALSVPLASLRSHLDQLQRDKQIVAYCRGPYCVLTAEAVRILRGEGFQAKRLVEGVAEWRMMGHRTNT